MLGASQAALLGMVRGGGAAPAERIFAVFDPYKKGTNLTIANEYLTMTSAGTVWKSGLCNLGKALAEGGKWYWETTVTTIYTQEYWMSGLANIEANLASYLGANTESLGCRYRAGAGWQAYYNGSVTTDNRYSDGAPANGDIIMHELDLDNDTYRQGRNGIWGSVYLSAKQLPSVLMGNDSGAFDRIFPAHAFYSTAAVTANFGQSPFVYEPPEGCNPGWYWEPVIAHRSLFNAADGTSLAAYTPDFGTALTQYGGGTWTINNNELGCAGWPAKPVLAVDTGNPDTVIVANIKLDTSNNGAGLAFRVVDASNFITVDVNPATTSAYVRKVVAGTASTVASASGLSITTGQTVLLKVVVVGSLLQVYLDGTLIITTTVSDFSTATKHGIGDQTYPNACRWLDLEIYA